MAKLWSIVVFLLYVSAIRNVCDMHKKTAVSLYRQDLSSSNEIVVKAHAALPTKTVKAQKAYLVLFFTIFK